MQWQGDPEGVDQRVHRGALRGLDPLIGDAFGPRTGDDLGIGGIEQDLTLRFVEIGVVLDRRRRQHPVDVVEDQPDVAQPPHAGLRTHGGQTDFDARVAERALLGLAGLVVEVHLLVGAPGHAHPPAAALVLIDKHDAVLAALVHRPRRARRHARRVEAVLADARQVEHERLLELKTDLLADLLQDRVAGHDFRGAAQVVVPVRRPRHLHRLAADQAARRRHRHVLTQRCGGEVLVVVGPGLVVVVDAGELRVGEDPQ